MAVVDYSERLHEAALAARTELVSSPIKRWEVFAKASTTREIEVTATRPLGVIEVEETGVAVRTWGNGRGGFAAASGLGTFASRQAVEGALATESPLELDPLPPARLFGCSDATTIRSLPPTGWASHVGGELRRSIAGRCGGGLELRRVIVQEGAFAWILTTAEDQVARHEDTSTALMAEVEAISDHTGVWRDWLHIPDPETFDVEAAAAQICDRAMLTRSKVATDSGLRDLIFHPEVTAQFLASICGLFLVTGEGEDSLPSLLGPDGHLAAPALSLVDDRLDSKAPVTGPCDGEGLPARRTLLLDGGIPRHRLGSYRDATRCSEVPRGGALRLSYRDYPQTGIANLRVVTEEGVSAGALLESADRALYLLRPLAPVVFEPSTDTYRIIASGVWLDGHAVRGWHPVVELRGSLGRLLRRIEAVGNDLRWFQTESGFIGAPSVLVRRQPVVG